MVRSPTFLSSHTATLHDLVTHIQIQPNLPICHPHYRPSEVTPEIQARFQSLPPDWQEDYLSLHLRNYLYDLYYSGELKPLAVEAAQPKAVLKNNTHRGIDATFYAQLHNANRGTGYVDPDWLVVARVTADQLAVKKAGLTVHIDPRRHLGSAHPLPQPGETVAIRLPRNRLETGYYVAVGNAGPGDVEQPALEISFHLGAKGAIALLETLTLQLNQAILPFQCKVLMDPGHYPRYDAGVLVLEQRHYAQARPLLAVVYEAVRSHLSPPIPLFNKPLAPGIGLVEVPENGADVGLQRCQIVADALLALEKQGNRSPESRLMAIAAGFQEAELDWQYPHLNPGSSKPGPVNPYLPLEGVA